MLNLSRLTMIETERYNTKFQIILGYLSDTLENQYFRFWLGSSDMESDWSWTDGTPMNFTNWAPRKDFLSKSPSFLDQPRAYGHCLSFHLLKGLWYASECTRKLPYLCEIFISS